MAHARAFASTVRQEQRHPLLCLFVKKISLYLFGCLLPAVNFVEPSIRASTYSFHAQSEPHSLLPSLARSPTSRNPTYIFSFPSLSSSPSHCPLLLFPFQHSGFSRRRKILRGQNHVTFPGCKQGVPCHPLCLSTRPVLMLSCYAGHYSLHLREYENFQEDHPETPAPLAANMRYCHLCELPFWPSLFLLHLCICGSCMTFMLLELPMLPHRDFFLTSSILNRYR